jgi:hypothetical protein
VTSRAQTDEVITKGRALQERMEAMLAELAEYIEVLENETSTWKEQSGDADT